MDREEEGSWRPMDHEVDDNDSYTTIAGLHRGDLDLDVTVASRSSDVKKMPADSSSTITTTTRTDASAAHYKNIKKLAHLRPESVADIGSIPTAESRRTQENCCCFEPTESSVPRQTMKAIVAIDQETSQTSQLFDDGVNARDLDPTRLSAALAQLEPAAPQASSPRSSVQQSPCFFHNRFSSAVNIDKVLADIAPDDEWTSHSTLMNTAAGIREVSKQLKHHPVKREVRNVMIVTKARDNRLVYYTRELTEWLLRTPRYGSDMGVNVYVDAKLKTSKRFDADGLVASEPRIASMLRYWTPDLCWSSPETFDLVLTLGGDGTVLYTSWLFQRVVPPVLSFSLGSLGFLTTFDFPSYQHHLTSVMGDQGMRVNIRMRFTCTVYRAPRSRNGVALMDEPLIESSQFEVLNELVIDRGPSPYVSNLELYGDDEFITIVQADGCIFSTPTGSTAYSLSAGGSLIHPDIPAILLTPICPHTLSFRPMVLSDSLRLKVCVPPASRSLAYASFDGKGRIELCRGDCVVVEASRWPFPSVCRQDGMLGEWIGSVRGALRWNVRGAPTAVGEDSVVQTGWGKGSEGGEGEDWDIEPDESALGIAAPDAPIRVDSGVGTSEEGSVVGCCS